MNSTEKLFLEDPYQAEFDAEVVSAGPDGIRLNKTIFYAMSGGQPGDVGSLVIANTNIPILSTRKGESIDDILHVPAEGLSLPAPGTKITGRIDWDVRHKH